MAKQTMEKPGPTQNKLPGINWNKFIDKSLKQTSSRIQCPACKGDNRQCALCGGTGIVRVL